MLRKRYKRYLEPESNADEQVPRTSAYIKRRREKNWKKNDQGYVEAPIPSEDTLPQQCQEHVEEHPSLNQNDDYLQLQSQERIQGQCIDSENCGDRLENLSLRITPLELHEEPEQYSPASPASVVGRIIASSINTSKTTMGTSSGTEAENEENCDIWFEALDYVDNRTITDFDNDDLSSLSDDDESLVSEREERNEHPDDGRQDWYDPYLSQTLCECTATTRGEAMAMTILLGGRHSLTWVAILDILKLINKLFSTDVMPTSKYMLFKHFPLHENTFKYHVFCPKCEHYVAEHESLRAEQAMTCDICNYVFDESTMSSFFMTLNFASQIHTLVNNPKIQEHLKYRFNRRKKNIEALEDIYDGTMYKALTGSLGEWDFTYTFSTDGCQAANSSNVSIWPIYAMLQELPPKLRSQHMFLVGLWVHKNQPNMNVFLKPFIDEANVLATTGIDWRLNDEIITSKVYPLCCCVDSGARHCLLNMIKFNGHYGCTFCEHPTESVDGYRKYPVSSRVPPDRTDQSIKNGMKNILNDDFDPDKNKGIKGPSVLMNLYYFNIALGMVPDYMHAVLLGVIRQWTEVILESPGTEYYVGTPNQLIVINRRLTSIKAPKCITRAMTTLKERKNWKASQWRSWLIWYAVICLQGVLPRKYLKHLSLLVVAIEILLQESITTQMLGHANKLLIIFATDCQQYFGKKFMTYNMHLILHVTTSVENWGPLWTHNAFCFENENRHVLLMKKSPSHIAKQIARRHLFYKTIPSHCEKFPIGPRFRQFCDVDLQHKVKFFVKLDGSTLIGSGKNYSLNIEEEACFGRALLCKSFQKIISNGFRYTTENYKRAKKINDSVIITKNRVFGIITNICSYDVIVNEKIEQKIIIFFREICVSNVPVISSNDVKLSHIKRCDDVDRGTLRNCSPFFLQGQCILMKISNENFISAIPRGCLGD